MMKTVRYLGHAVLTIVLLFSGLALPRAGFARRSKKRWRTPIVMEQATLRGKIVVIEDRAQDRRTLEGMTVRVWSIAEPSAEDEKPQKNRFERGKLLHDTKTDDLGMFSLPVLEQGEYLLLLGELRLVLKVVPKSEKRKDQEEPAVLLIMLPKEVVTQKKS